MKKRPELDVDFIQSRPLTEEEHKLVSEIIRKSKAKRKKKYKTSHKTSIAAEPKPKYGKR